MCCISEPDPLKHLEFRKNGVIMKPKIDFRTSVPACIADEERCRRDDIDRIFDFFLFFANRRILTGRASSGYAERPQRRGDDDVRRASAVPLARITVG